MSDIAIIGAGMAGLACATRLAASGRSVVLFDKGRGPGGRMATRRAEVNGKTVRFDHGAQYFTVRDPAFIEAVANWRKAGAVASWPAAGKEALVGTPGMNAPLRRMAEALKVHWGTRVQTLSRNDICWQLSFEGDRPAEQFAQVVVAIPAEQAADLLAEAAPDWSGQAAASTSQPCWALMASFAEKLPLNDVFQDSDIAWAARGASKPGRDAGEHWVIHASPQWSQTFLELAPETAAVALLARFCELAGIPKRVPVHSAAHRWRYAMAEKPANGGNASPMLWDKDKGLGVCGDWLANPRVEGAWVSGDSLARTIEG
ncbi:NAD(P)/FAD-dependent oxidoreductase [Qipengyuania sp. DSG2-2]|uniref:NAD(P)/FAD-dependent oxidoreductase n=1 Tax=Qipengyuania sp. DGS2-2 TaxID=3349631 RepID=UPI0036D4374C